MGEQPLPSPSWKAHVGLKKQNLPNVHHMHLGLTVCALHTLVRNNKLQLIRLKIKTRVFIYLLLLSDL